MPVFVTGQQRITYTGKSSNDWTGTKVAGKTGLAPSALSAAMVAGTAGNIAAGPYDYKVTFIINGGETEGGSTSSAVTITHVTAPGALSAAVSSGTAGNLSAGDYRYKVSYVTTAGETEAGTATSIDTISHVTSPGSAPSLAATTGGSMALGFYWFAVTYITAAGETLAAYTGSVELTGANNAVSLTSIPTSGDGRVTGRNIYRGPVNNSGGFRLVATIANNSSTTLTATVADSGLGAPLPSVNTSGSGQMSLTSIPTSSDGRVTARKIYRTQADGTTYKLLTTIGNNSTTSATDNTADGSLGNEAPTVNTSGTGQVNLTSIPTGPTGTTARRIYRIRDGIGAPHRLLATISNNTDTTRTDNISENGVGEVVPTTSTVGPSAGDTSLYIQELEQMNSTGWATVAGILIRYTGKSGASGPGTLTGLPASGTGALTASVPYDSVVLNAPHLTGIPSSGPGSVQYPIATGDQVNLLVERNDTAAQAALAGYIGGDGIQELYIQDRRLSETEAIARADAHLALAKDPLVTVTYETRDQTTKAGRDVTFTLGPPTDISGTFKIQTVLIDQIDPLQLTFPRRVVTASSRRFTFESLLRLIGRTT